MTYFLYLTVPSNIDAFKETMRLNI